LIEIELAVEGEHVILRMVDDGRPFDPRKGPALDLNAEDREIGGLGLILVLEMVDVLRYQRVEDKNRVEVRIRLVPDEAGGQPEPVAAETVASS
jgi:serine/threonine-protein kinase RsbW/sigma-B regulation protein RsbU (phosphoserine phosphatase)